MIVRPLAKAKTKQLPDHGVTKCAGRITEWQWTALHGDWQMRRALAAGLCRGCPLLDGRCAAVAMDQQYMPDGMVWAGIPVPADPRHPRYKLAVQLLRLAAGHG